MRKTATAVLALAVAIGVGLLMTPTPAAAEPGGTEMGERDARAEAGVDNGPASQVGTLATWYSGTMAPGASSSWVWNNAPATTVYEVSLRPTGATTAASCQFEKTRDWYSQQPGGEREYHWTIKNVGSISCGTTVYLSGLAASHTGSTAGISPGSSITMHWNNANPQGSVYKLGLTPKGATGSIACKLEVTRDWYKRSSVEEREYYFTVKNIGTIACAADTQYAKVPAGSTWSSGSIAAGSSSLQAWNNPASSKVFLLGLNPVGVSCQMEITRSWYQQYIDSNGAIKYRLYFYVKNLTSSSSCSATVQVSWIAAA